MTSKRHQCVDATASSWRDKPKTPFGQTCPLATPQNVQSHWSPKCKCLIGEISQKTPFGQTCPLATPQNVQSHWSPKCKCLIGEISQKTPFGRTCLLSTPGEDAAPLTPLNGSAKTAPRIYGGWCARPETSDAAFIYSSVCSRILHAVADDQTCRCYSRMKISLLDANVIYTRWQWRNFVPYKTLRNVCYSAVAEIRFIGRLMITWTFSWTNWLNFIRITWQIFTH